MPDGFPDRYTGGPELAECPPAEEDAICTRNPLGSVFFSEEAPCVDLY